MSAATDLDELRSALAQACADVRRVAGVECFAFNETFWSADPQARRMTFVIFAGPRAFVGLFFDEKPAWLERIAAFRSRPVVTPVTTAGWTLSLDERLTPPGDRAAAAVASLMFFVELMIDQHLVRHPEDERTLFPHIDDAAIERIFGAEP